MQCVKCPPGWMFKNFRCIIMYENENIGTFQQDKQSCAAINSGVLTFFDDIDLLDCIQNSFPQSYYVSFTKVKKFFLIKNVFLF